MFVINKLREDPVIDFAALELKKYLRMMMYDCGDIKIFYDPETKTGFRLGLLEDFGLPFEGKDAFWDDVVHIDTDEQGGILAGSNPRSVLFAVYRYLKLNGCRFFAPGPDGEYIPQKDIAAQSYHKLADNRIRGFTIEGRPSIHNVLDYIDYHGKCELNRFNPSSPFVYMGRYYTHDQLQNSREPEPITNETAKQWMRQIECECAQRGQILGMGGHDEIAYVYGMDPKDRELYKKGVLKPTEEMKANMAMLDGKRDLYRNDPFFTNFCMSRPELRQIYIEKKLEFIRKNQHYETVGFSLADLPRNHCECEECQKLYPTDFQVMMLNDLDEMLTAEGIKTKLNFSSYVDQQFAPKQEKLKNHSRFIMSFPPISRSYTSSITEDSVYPEVVPYVRNKWKSPSSIEELLAYFKHWKKTQNLQSPTFVFEYHFWVHQYRDPGTIAMCRRLYEDIRSLPLMDMSGYVEDGSNKSFFPNGLQSYVYNQTLMNRDVKFEDLVEDYFSIAYGEDWEQVYKYLQKISELFDHKYMCGEKPTSGTHSIYYDPSRVAKFDEVIELAKQMETYAHDHRVQPLRIQSVHWQLLEHHARWCMVVADVMKVKCCGHDEESLVRWRELIDDFGKYDYELDRYFDMSLASYSYSQILRKVKPAADFA